MGEDGPAFALWGELLAGVVPWMAVVFRVLGLFAISPILSGVSMPRRGRVLLGFAMGTAAYAGMGGRAVPVPDVGVFGAAGVIVAELAVGVGIGYVASLPIAAMRMGGQVISHQMGLSIAQSYDPMTGAQTDSVERLLSTLGLGGFILVGGLDALLLVLLRTFEIIPIGFIAAGETGEVVPLGLAVGVLGSGMELALRIAAPVMGVILAILLALAFIMRTIPQLNVMSVGFSIKIFFGLLVLAFAIGAANSAMMDEVILALEAIAAWLEGVGEHAAGVAGGG